MDPRSIDAVIFDMGGVFILPHHEPLRAGLAAAGFEASDEVAHYHRAHYAGVRALTATTEHDESSKAFWRHYHLAYLATIGLSAEVADAAQRSFAKAFGGATAPVWRQVVAESVVGLRRLADAGVPVAVVSNNDGTAARQLLDLGIAQVGPGPLVNVAIVVDSGSVGVAKPNPAIFAPALAALGVAAARALYVGDTVHADVRGARAAGMQVVQVDPYDDHADHDHPRVRDVAHLADVLLGA